MTTGGNADSLSGTGAPPVGVGRALLPHILSSLLLSLAFSIWFALAIGRDLGLLFGGLVLATILAPMLMVSEHGLPHRASLIAGIVAAISIVWLSCVFNDTITLIEWFRATLVLLFYTLAITGLAALSARFRIPPAVIVILALAWLSWPIWLAPALRGESAAERTVARLVAGNPTFAIQGALSRSFPRPWAEHRIAYRLTNIGDDISYTMPTSIFRCIIYHGIIAIIAWFAADFAARPARPPADQSPRLT